MQNHSSIHEFALREKYTHGNETTVAEVQARVAKALSAKEPGQESVFQQALETFIPGGRINASAGTNRVTTLLNCFVQPIGDTITGEADGRPGIYVALQESAETMRRGGGVGYNFSAIRPKGARVKGTDSRASGPVSYMHLFNTSCTTVESAGARRGAQMAVLNIDHPDIEEFIHSKDKGDLKGFNISVGVTDAFMEAVENDAQWDLVHVAEPSDELKAQGAYQQGDLWVYRSVKARDLWEQVMTCTYDHADPGVLNLSKINKENNLWYCEVLEATNPYPLCGPLLKGSAEKPSLIDLEAPAGATGRKSSMLP